MNFRGIVSLAEIDYIVSLHLGSARADKSHRQQPVFSRHVAMFLAHDKYGWSTPPIGKFYTLHHTTVVYGIRKIRDSLTSNGELSALLDQLTSEIAEYHDKTAPLARINTTGAHQVIPKKKLLNIQMARLADMIADRLYSRFVHEYAHLIRGTGSPYPWNL